MVRVEENSNVMIDEYLERQMYDKTNQEETGESSGILSCNVWMGVMDSEKRKE